MLDILISILEELFGTDSKKTARRPPSGGPAQPVPSFDDVVRQLLGGQQPAEAEQEPDPEPAVPPPVIRSAPPPPPPAPVRSGVESRKPKAARRQKKAAAEAEIRELEGTLGRMAAEDTRPAASPAPKAPAAPVSAAVPGSAYAAELRGNPAAARRAFVYAEIFGKPLADRQECR